LDKTQDQEAITVNADFSHQVASALDQFGLASLHLHVRFKHNGAIRFFKILQHRLIFPAQGLDGLAVTL
jgi:hypothetical protein